MAGTRGTLETDDSILTEPHAKSMGIAEKCTYVG